MNLKELTAVLEPHADSTKAVGMKAYMRDQFEFLGLQATQRRRLAGPLLRGAKHAVGVDWDFVFGCWACPQREYQYVAVDYLQRVADRLEITDAGRLKALITTKSWWDTVDGIAPLLGALAAADPAGVDLMLEWSTDSNLWVRRVALLHQLRYRDQTDPELLERIIEHNLGQSEFFINKAIGWALREYSKTDASWVRGFVARKRDRMAQLSITEASKYL